MAKWFDYGPGCSKCASQVDVDVTGAADQAAFEALMPDSFPMGYTDLDINVTTAGAQSWDLDPFLADYAIPSQCKGSFQVHNSGPGDLTYTNTVTGSTLTIAQDEWVTFKCCGGSWVVR